MRESLADSLGGHLAQHRWENLNEDRREEEQTWEKPGTTNKCDLVAGRERKESTFKEVFTWASGQVMVSLAKMGSTRGGTEAGMGLDGGSKWVGPIWHWLWPLCRGWGQALVMWYWSCSGERSELQRGTFSKAEAENAGEKTSRKKKKEQRTEPWGTQFTGPEETGAGQGGVRGSSHQCHLLLRNWGNKAWKWALCWPHGGHWWRQLELFQSDRAQFQCGRNEREVRVCRQLVQMALWT